MNDNRQNSSSAIRHDYVSEINKIKDGNMAHSFTPGSETKKYGPRKLRCARSQGSRFSSCQLHSENDEMAWSPSISNDSCAQELDKYVNLPGNISARTSFSPGRSEKVFHRRERKGCTSTRRAAHGNTDSFSIPNIPIQTERHANVTRKVTGMHTPKSIYGETGISSEIHRLRIQGNEAFKLKNYKLACIKYSSSICLVRKFPSERYRSLGLPLLYCNRAAAYLALGKPLEALEDCKSGMSVDSSFSKCYVRGATCFIRMGQFAEARGILDCAPVSIEVQAKLKEIDASQEDFLLFFKRAGYVDGNSGEKIDKFPNLSSIINAYRLLENSIPHSVALMASIVVAHIRFGDICGADRILENILKMNPTNPPKWAGWCRVQTCFFKADYYQCQRNIDCLVRLLQTSKDEYNSDIELLQQVIQIPENSLLSRLKQKLNEICKIKAYSNGMMKDRAYDKAIELYSEALSADALSPAMAAILFSNRAAAYHAVQKRALALADCCKSISILPQYAKPYSRIATILSELGLFKEGEKFMRQAISHAHDTKRKEYQSILNNMIAKSSSAKEPNYLLLLGVDTDTSFCAIKKSYRKLALRLHPDKALLSTKIKFQLDESGIKVMTEFETRKNVLDHATWLFKLLGEAQNYLEESSTY